MVSSSGQNANDLVFRRYHANAVATGRWKLSVRFCQRWLAKEGSVVLRCHFFKRLRVLEGSETSATLKAAIDVVRF